jgi:N-methylhydantoinase A
MRFAIDTGGTFTDLLVEADDGQIRMYKASTTPDDPIRGVLEALAKAAADAGDPLPVFLGRGSALIYGTTHAINAIITGNTARTAFLTTRGHPDILTLREGGRSEPFNFTVPFPSPLIPRALTWEVGGRILADGSVREDLDEAGLLSAIEEMKHAGIEAAAVCLLWSVVNPVHERRVGELLERHLPGVAVTLSYELNPTIREFRRASSACIDASLKPMMKDYFAGLESRLSSAGFKGRVLVVTSQGGVVDAADAAAAPIHLINSGPSMAPVSGGYFARVDEATDTAIIADTGGTTYDVSLVRRGEVPTTRETWIGQPYRGHMTGFPSVDVKSVGAGGGSIAWIDDGGMLHVGPLSAGSTPGPICYGRGGSRPTVTDAAVALGYIDPDYFLGGSIRLDAEAARRGIEREIARPLGIPVEEASGAILLVATENMVQAIVDITVNQGIDPRHAVLVGGGGAAGLNSVAIARRLQSPKLLIPQVGAALSAAGAMMSDLRAHFNAHQFTTSSAFDHGAVNAILADLASRARRFVEGPGQGSPVYSILYKAEARYAEQVWDIEVPLKGDRIADAGDLRAVLDTFHRTHEDIFAVSDPGSVVEFVGWTAIVSVPIRGKQAPRLADVSNGQVDGSRPAWFAVHGLVDTAVRSFERLRVDEPVHGPAIVESSFTTVVIDPGATAVRRASGSLSIDPGSGGVA